MSRRFSGGYAVALPMLNLRVYHVLLLKVYALLLQLVLGLGVRAG